MEEGFGNLLKLPKGIGASDLPSTDAAQRALTLIIAAEVQAQSSLLANHIARAEGREEKEVLEDLQLLRDAAYEQLLEALAKGERLWRSREGGQ